MTTPEQKVLNMNVSPLTAPAPGTQPFEIVERKGLGHPDTICDALAEEFSRGLARFYLERFGRILHHNVDKALLCGGIARADFGGGEVLEPIEIHLAGRATREFQGVKIPVDEIALATSEKWLQENLSHLDLREHVRIVPHIRPTSADLATLFDGGGASRAPLANDTSFGVGFAPLDALETTVLTVARTLNAPQVRSAHPSIGEDIKVMGTRRERQFELTVACALVGRHINDLADYEAKKQRVRSLALEAARTVTDTPLNIFVNAADGETPESVYLTVTGLSAEAGDDGQVGRGNRVNGLITPYRPMSLEAAAGKNPVTHVGKLYNVMANRIAHALVAAVPEVEEAYCYLCSRIGRPIAEPSLFELKVRLAEPARLDALRSQITAAVQTTFGEIESLWREALEGRLSVW